MTYSKKEYIIIKTLRNGVIKTARRDGKGDLIFMFFVGLLCGVGSLLLFEVIVTKVYEKKMKKAEAANEEKEEVKEND